jgi:hypothetical protein
MGEKDEGTQTPFPHLGSQPRKPSSDRLPYESLVRSFSVAISQIRGREVFVVDYVDSCEITTDVLVVYLGLACKQLRFCKEKARVWQ